jgi:small multidrug resistance pump
VRVQRATSDPGSDAFSAYRLHAGHPYGADMVVRILLAIGASVCFVTGSMFMKPSEGLTRLWPTVAVFAAFAAGLVLDIVLVRMGDGVAAAFFLVIGLESVLAVGLSSWLYSERITIGRTVAMALVLAGVLLLAAADGHDGDAHGGGGSAGSQPFAQLGTVADTELGVDALEVGIDGAPRDHQALGQFVAPRTGGDGFGDLELAS